jgi:uncharacterized protein (TIGR02145 family)
MKSKYLLLLAACIFVASTEAYANKLDQDGILRYDYGPIRRMSQFYAMLACPHGTHLPTIRELAVLSQASGAKGILEVSQVDPNAVPAGYRKVSAINPNGQKDEFYFNHEGYKRPSGDLANNMFWSSSVVADDRYSDNSYYGYFFYGGEGWVSYYVNLSSGNLAVRCVVGH